ncbi:hypothetical protein Bca101_020377 [Brassica carinata]
MAETPGKIYQLLLLHSLIFFLTLAPSTQQEQETHHCRKNQNQKPSPLPNLKPINHRRKSHHLQISKTLLQNLSWSLPCLFHRLHNENPNPLSLLEKRENEETRNKGFSGSGGSLAGFMHRLRETRR